MLEPKLREIFDELQQWIFLVHNATFSQDKNPTIILIHQSNQFRSYDSGRRYLMSEGVSEVSFKDGHKELINLYQINGDELEVFFEKLISKMQTTWEFFDTRAIASYRHRLLDIQNDYLFIPDLDHRSFFLGICAHEVRHRFQRLHPRDDYSTFWSTSEVFSGIINTYQQNVSFKTIYPEKTDTELDAFLVQGIYSREMYINLVLKKMPIEESILSARSIISMDNIKGFEKIVFRQNVILNTLSP